MNDLTNSDSAREHISMRFSSSSEASASELLENREEMFLRYWYQFVGLEQIAVCTFSIPLLIIITMYIALFFETTRRINKYNKWLIKYVCGDIFKC